MPPESRAEYFKDRRAKFKSFTVEVEREKMEAFERKLQERQESKKEWLDKKIDEELGRTARRMHTKHPGAFLPSGGWLNLL